MNYKELINFNFHDLQQAKRIKVNEEQLKSILDLEKKLNQSPQYNAELYKDLMIQNKKNKKEMSGLIVAHMYKFATTKSKGVLRRILIDMDKPDDRIYDAIVKKKFHVAKPDTVRIRAENIAVPVADNALDRIRQGARLSDVFAVGGIIDGLRASYQYMNQPVPPGTSANVNPLYQIVQNAQPIGQPIGQNMNAPLGANMSANVNPLLNSFHIPNIQHAALAAQGYGINVPGGLAFAAAGAVAAAARDIQNRYEQRQDDNTSTEESISGVQDGNPGGDSDDYPGDDPGNEPDIRQQYAYQAPPAPAGYPDNEPNIRQQYAYEAPPAAYPDSGEPPNNMLQDFLQRPDIQEPPQVHNIQGPAYPDIREASPYQAPSQAPFQAPFQANPVAYPNIQGYAQSDMGETSSDMGEARLYQYQSQPIPTQYYPSPENSLDIVPPLSPEDGYREPNAPQSQGAYGRMSGETAEQLNQRLLGPTLPDTDLVTTPPDFKDEQSPFESPEPLPFNIPSEISSVYQSQLSDNISLPELGPFTDRSRNQDESKQDIEPDRPRFDEPARLIRRFDSDLTSEEQVQRIREEEERNEEASQEEILRLESSDDFISANLAPDTTAIESLHNQIRRLLTERMQDIEQRVALIGEAQSEEDVTQLDNLYRELDQISENIQNLETYSVRGLQIGGHLTQRVVDTAFSGLLALMSRYVLREISFPEFNK